MKKIDNGTILFFCIVILIAVIISFVANERNNLLKNDFTISKAKIIEVELNVIKGTMGTQNITKYTYIFNNKTYKKTVNIHYRSIKTGDCYKLKIANKNPSVVKIDLNKKVKCYE